jgi:phosphosulfolactate synthase
MNYLELPCRSVKPREEGINILIDNGYPLKYFQDVIESFNDKVDFVKFGWCTSIVVDNIHDKISILNKYNIDYFFGGTLFEKFLHQDNLNGFRKFLDTYNCKYIEISNGVIEISNSEKCQYIKDFSKDFKVFSEVGLKDSEKSEEMHPKKWIEYMLEDLDAGSIKVITEARENGRSGMCRSNGDIRIGLFEEIIDSELNLDNIIFEAPNVKTQAYFIKKVGVNCNLANISFPDIIGLETLRYGIRSDTFFLFEK